MGREFTPTILLHKKFASCPKLKIWKTIFFLIFKKRNLKNYFPNFKFGTGSEFLVEGDHWHKFSSPHPNFYGSIFIFYDHVIISYDPIVISAAIGDCYFGGHRRSSFHYFGDRRSLFGNKICFFVSLLTMPFASRFTI